MRKEVMKKWVKALISGKYKQGTGTLKQYNRKGEAQHCCLGVLCELYNNQMKKNKKKTLSEKFYNNDCDYDYGYTKFNTYKDGLPKEVRKWAGIKNSIGKFQTNEVDEECLADLNDTGRKFKTIANIIEKYYEKL